PLVPSPMQTEAAPTAPPAAAPALGVSGARSSLEPAPAASPKLSLSAKVLVSAGAASMQATCTTSDCRGTLQLVGRIVVHHGGKRSHASVVLARGSFDLAAGVHGSIRLRLTSAGAERFAHGAIRRLSGRLSYELRGGGSGAQAVTVR
ncbi:MAG TPA: hypothetical protein VK774_05335, partial [Solirubrobacteraceae bacterium]|nr:hypothetical protein [Solirubrobacteraceae bacterium]